MKTNLSNVMIEVKKDQDELSEIEYYLKGNNVKKSTIELNGNCSMLGRLMDSFTTEDNAIDYWFSLSYQELISIFSDVSNN